MISEKELQTLKDEQQYWLDIERLIPTWRLVGWTYKDTATFDDSAGNVINLTGTARNDIVKAINNRCSSERIS